MLTRGSISHSLNLDVNLRSVAVFAAPCDVIMISRRRPCEGGLRHYASDELREKRGLLFGNALIPPCLSAPRSVWCPHKTTSVFAGNGGTNPSWKAVSAAHVQAGTLLK